MPTPKPPTNVIDLTERRLERMPHVSLEADTDAMVVVQTFHYPTLGDVRCAYTSAQVVDMIYGLIREGSKISSTRWSQWCSHLGECSSLVHSRGRAESFCHLWRATRPSVHLDPPPSRTVVVAAAIELAETVLRSASEHGTHEQLSTEGRGWLEHLTYDGAPLAAWPTCPQGHGCEWSVPWDLL
jgi:hypothetical protein